MERVVISNTRKFHYPSCGIVGKMKESNKLYYTDTRDDLISQGYNLCGNCHPLSNRKSIVPSSGICSTFLLLMLSHRGETENKLSLPVQIR